jgi:hypothetical protein
MVAMPHRIGRPATPSPFGQRKEIAMSRSVRLSIVVIGATLLFLMGCATVRFTPTGESYPSYGGAVKILKAYPEEGAYDEIGWVSADGDFNTPWSELLGLMQKEAAAHGANAIVIEEKFTTQMDTPQYSVGVNQQNDVRSVTAVAIRANKL